MGELAARTLFSNDTGPLAGVGLDTLAKNQAAILELEGAQEPISCTIATGSISPTAAYVIVDTEGSAAADGLDAINQVLSASENLHTGMIVNLKAADSGRVVTVKNSSRTNGINTYDGNDYVLSTTHWLKLQLRADGKWYEIEGRAMGVALAAATSAANAATAAGHAQTKSGTSSTASGTSAKVVTCSGFELSDQARIFVTFSNANTVADAITLNVNGTGAKPVYNQAGIISTTNTALFAANQPIEFRYDGTGWVFYDAEKLVAPLVAGKANVDLGNVTGNAIGFYLHARDVKTTGTKGGTATGGAWNTRDLNAVVVNRIAGASLSSNRITLPPGKYIVRATAPCSFVGRARIAIYNYTTSAYEIYGMSEYAVVGQSGSATLILNGELEVSATTTIELRMWAESTYASAGCGIESGITGVPEYYSEVQIWKI